MKTHSLIITLSSFLFIWSCTKDSTSQCLTVGMTYTKNIKSIIDANCVSCHGSTNPSGSVRLVTYTEVKSVNPINFKGVINHSQSFKAMPPTSKMSQCNIDMIEAWLNAGSPEN
jgi:hypothetical protein